MKSTEERGTRRSIYAAFTANPLIAVSKFAQSAVIEIAHLEQMPGVTAFDNSFDFPGVAIIRTMRFPYEHLKANPDALGWWTYLFTHARDRVLVGEGGYKGKADDSGMVEIGYAIVPAYRGHGLATEVARGFIDHAFSHACRAKRLNEGAGEGRNESCWNDA